MGKRQQGFTLVEIAVVMVIIGLLLGGVLKGQELINSAKVKSVINDFRNTSTHVFGYQDRFRAMPGDDPGVANRLAGAVRASTGGSRKVRGLKTIPRAARKNTPAGTNSTGRRSRFSTG